MRLFAKFAILCGVIIAACVGLYFFDPKAADLFDGNRTIHLNRNEVAGSAPPSGEFKSILQTTVERTVSGENVNLKITVLIPPATEYPYRNIYLYGWLGDDEEDDGVDDRLSVGECWNEPECEEGFPVKKGPFTPGERVTVEVNLRRSFVEAEDAHFYLGLGDNQKGYYPSNDLLAPPPAPPAPTPAKTPPQ